MPSQAARPKSTQPSTNVFQFLSQVSWGSALLQRVQSVDAVGPLRELSAQLVARPHGHFMSSVAPGPEALRDFARVFLSRGQSRKVYIMARGMVSLRPLQLSAGLGTAAVGELPEGIAAKAQMLFIDALSQWLLSVGAPPVPTEEQHPLCEAVAAAMSGSVGIDFSQHAGLLPTFMQPMFVLLILGGSREVLPQMRLLTYGFVAGCCSQVSAGSPESKHTPFCARLTSPDLLAADVGTADSCWEWEYNVYRVRTTNIREAAERDAARLRAAIGSGKWS